MLLAAFLAADETLLTRETLLLLPPPPKLLDIAEAPAFAAAEALLIEDGLEAYPRLAVVLPLKFPPGGGMVNPF
jgi:hypothetical protein